MSSGLGAQADPSLPVQSGACRTLKDGAGGQRGWATLPAGCRALGARGPPHCTLATRLWAGCFAHRLSPDRGSGLQYCCLLFVLSLSHTHLGWRLHFLIPSGGVPRTALLLRTPFGSFWIWRGGRPRLEILTRPDPLPVPSPGRSAAAFFLLSGSASQAREPALPQEHTRSPHLVHAPLHLILFTHLQMIAPSYFPIWGSSPLCVC